jgi:hypothetical protein
MKGALIFTGVGISYLVLYTAYDKKTKRWFVWDNLFDVLLLRRSTDFTLVEINKAISLTGLTSVILGFIPETGSDEHRKELLYYGAGALLTHTAYSIYKFEIYPPKILSHKGVKRISYSLGTLGQLALFMNQATASILLGVSHFWTMEVDFKWKLQVRPYAYLPFPLAAYALYRIYKD